jgi:hypothetical protein
MRLLNPDGTPTDGAPEPGAGKPVWRLPPDTVAVIEADGPNPVVVETPDATIVLEAGTDYMVVAKDRYLRLVTELSVFKDFERRALSSFSRRERRRRGRDARP